MVKDQNLIVKQEPIQKSSKLIPPILQPSAPEAKACNFIKIKLIAGAFNQIIAKLIRTTFFFFFFFLFYRTRPLTPFAISPKPRKTNKKINTKCQGKLS